MMLSLGVITSGILSPHLAHAQTVINYPSGFSSSPSAITLRGTANFNGSAIELTNYNVHNASNAWFVTPVNVQGFTTTFTWKVVCPSGGTTCGDGMGFIIMDTSNPDGNPGYWTGWSGAQFSYSEGCTLPSTGNTNCVPTKSVLVKFDLYNINTYAQANLTGLYTGGEWPQPPNPQYDMAPSGINMQSGHLMKATLAYNGSTLYETVTDTVTNATYSNSYQVNIPAQVGGNTALVGFGGGTGAAEVEQNIESWTYTEQASGAATAVTPAPTFSPAGGTLASSEAVEIADAASSANIYYTTDGSTPGTASTKYTAPITVKSSETVKAIAVASGQSASSVASAAYSISSSGSSSTTATPSFSPAAGTYSSTQSVTVSDSTSGSTIYYTTNGSTPSTSSTKYTGPISVGSTETLKAIAVDSGSANSSVGTAAYTINTTRSSSPQTVINFPNGFSGSPSSIEPITTAFFTGDSIQLTSQKESEAANVYFKSPVNVQHFTTTFTWTAKCPSSGGCGDGMGFIIISSNNPDSPRFWSGWSGAQLSWSEGCTTPTTGDTNCKAINSVLVKFDLFNTATSSGNANLTGLYTRGEWPQSPNPQYDMAPSGIDMESGHLMKANLTYNGSTLYETVTDTVTNKSYSNSYSVNIPAIVGGNTAIVGFGGGTGAATVQQNIDSWTYTVE